MKKHYLLLFTILIFFFFTCCTFFAPAQGIYQLWGTTTYGGPDDYGTLFTTRFDGTGHDVKKFFTTTNPGIPHVRNKPVAYTFNNNVVKFYCLLNEGGLSSSGIISEYDPVAKTYSKKADLFSIGGQGGLGYDGAAMVEYNGKLYGVVDNSVNLTGGVLFEYDPVTNILTKKHDFTDATGSRPSGDLVVFGNKLYGITNYGGINSHGVIYEFDPNEPDPNLNYTNLL